MDGIRVGRDQNYTAPKPYDGYWRIGADQTSGFTNRPTDAGLAGSSGRGRGLPQGPDQGPRSSPTTPPAAAPVAGAPCRLTPTAPKSRATARTCIGGSPRHPVSAVDSSGSGAGGNVYRHAGPQPGGRDHG